MSSHVIISKVFIAFISLDEDSKFSWDRINLKVQKWHACSNPPSRLYVATRTFACVSEIEGCTYVFPVVECV